MVFLRNKNFCPVCGSQFEQFRPISKMYAENAEKTGYKYYGKAEFISLETYHCPECFASDRERLYAFYLKKKFGRKSRIKMIHFAPESGLQKMIKKNFPLWNYCSADISGKDVDIRCDLTDLSVFRDEEFDFFICSHVLEHIENDVKAISELFRILKRGATAILVAPVFTIFEESIENLPGVESDADRWRYYGQNDHVRLYSKRDYVSRLSNAGFVVKELGLGYFGARVFRKLGVIDTAVLYVVEKK